MGNTLRHCLPSIRFFSLSSKEFLQKVCPYKKLLKPQLYKDLKSSYLDPDSEPNENIFIFSFKNKNNFFKNAIISNVVDPNHAILHLNEYGPHFNDISIEFLGKFTTDYTDYDMKNILMKKI